MLWSIVQVIGKQGIALLIFIILALFIDPADFGILAMAMAWIAFIQVFSELGFGAALIQKQSVTTKHYSTIFVINVAVGIFLTFIGILLSWPCALFFKTPNIQPVVVILSIGFLINSFSLTQMAIAQREMRFRDLAIRDISAALIGGIAGIILAWLKYGIWALVIQSLVTYLIGSLLLWHMLQWRPTISEFSLQCAKELWSYSSKIFAFNIFKYFAQNTDKLLIGYLLGPVALGLYTFAFKLVVFPASNIVGAIGSYLFPMFASMQENLEAINKYYIFTMKSINSILTPTLVIIAFLSPVLVPSIWGEKWMSAVPLIQIFTVLAIAQSLVSPVGQLMKALDRPGWLLNWSIFITLVVSILISLGIYYKGIVGAAYGITIAYIIGVAINFFIVYKLTSIRLFNILNSLLPSFLSSSLMVITLFFMLDYNLFFVGLVLSALLYLISLIWLDKPFLGILFRKLVRV